jgi:hypothetical protein
VRKTIERILNARLADSLMFWAEDHKRLPLAQMAADLSGVTFHEKLGSMAEKTVRLRTISEPVAEAFGRGMGAMGTTKGIIYIDACKASQLLCKYRVVFFFASVEAQVFEEHEAAGGQIMGKFADTVPHTVLRKNNVHFGEQF